MNFFKKLKNVKLSLFVLMIIAFLFLILYEMHKSLLYFVLIWLDLIVFLVIYYRYYKCPYCGEHLGKKYSDRNKCKNCGKDLK